MQDISLEEVLDKIISREISIRQASKSYGFSRDIIRAELNRKYANDKEKMNLIKIIMKENKENSTALIIEQEKLEENFFKVMNKEITLKEAQIELGNVDSQTLKEKFGALVEKTENFEIARKYSAYIRSQNSDYSNINFRIVAIRMMRNNLSQTEIAEELGIHPRTLSREFEKLSTDEDTRLYDLLKSYSDLKMRRYKFKSDEIILLDKLLTNYEENFPELLQTPEKTKTEIFIEREDYLVTQAEKLKKEGLTQKQIADKLGTSVSTLRRAKIAKTQREKIHKIFSEIEDFKDEVK